MRRLALALTLLLSGCGWLDYPRLGIAQGIWQGGQSSLDAGHVTQYTSRPAVGTEIWLAGHRTTHGAVFARLPNARVGDDVWVNGRHYRVSALMLLPHIWGARYLGPLVLQTSTGGRTAPVLVVVCEPA